MNEINRAVSCEECECLVEIAEAAWAWAYDIEDDATALRIDEVIAYIDTITDYAFSEDPYLIAA